MFALLEFLTECCRAHPRQRRRAQLVMGVDETKPPMGLLVVLFELQVDRCFWLSLRWVPTADNQSADAIT